MEKNKKIIIGIVVAVLLLLLILFIYFMMNRSYTVTFDSNGGTEVESQIVKRNQTATKPEDPTREGYQFVGWYYAERQQDEYDFSTKVTRNLELIAKWSKEETGISSVKINSDKTIITVGDELSLSLEIEPEGIDPEELEITWSSSDESIATVSSEGKVTAIKAGKVTITVTVNGTSTSIELTIEEAAKEEETTTEANSNTSTNKKPTTSTKPSTNTNTSTDTGTNDDSNANTEEPTPTPEPEPEPVTYTYEWVKADTSVAGQYRLYIVSSEGERVAGTATLKTLSGKTETVSIPASGKLFVKDTITSVSNVKGN